MILIIIIGIHNICYGSHFYLYRLAFSSFTHENWHLMGHTNFYVFSPFYSKLRRRQRNWNFKLSKSFHFDGSKHRLYLIRNFPVLFSGRPKKRRATRLRTPGYECFLSFFPHHFSLRFLWWLHVFRHVAGGTEAGTRCSRCISSGSQLKDKDCRCQTEVRAVIMEFVSITSNLVPPST